MARRVLSLDYTAIGGGISRPYLLVALRHGERRSPLVPMLIDTGADACYFDHQLAYTLGIDPVHGGQMSEVQALNTAHPSARFPVTLALPQFGLELPVQDAYFTTLQRGWNGLLGHRGFLERFERVTFAPGRTIELVMGS